MKPIWHIFKKDLVHLRLALGLWVLLLGGELFFYRLLLMPAASDGEWFARIQMYLGLLDFVTWVVCYLMMAGLVLEDPAVGTRMFWATRPISGGRLLGAKLLGILLLFGVLPMLVRLPWWLYCGYGWRELGGAAAQDLAIVGGLAIPAVVLATLSGQSSRFLLYSLLLVVALPIATALLAARPGTQPSPELIQSRIVLCLLLCWASGSVAAVVQFLTRRLVRSFVILGVGVGLAVLCLFTWPWRLDRLAPENRTQLAGTGPISVEILTAEISPANQGPTAENTPVSLTLGIKNLPEDMFVLRGLTRIKLRWPDGFVVRQPNRELSAWSHNDSPALRHILALPPHQIDPATARKLADLREESLRRRLPAAPHTKRVLTHLPAGEISFSCTLFVTPTVAARIKAEPPACSISARLVVGRPEVLFELPMHEGAGQAGQGARLQVVRLEEVHPKGGLTDPLLKKYTLTLVSATAPSVRPAFYRIDRRRGDCEQILNRTSYRSVFLSAPTKIERLSCPLSAPRLWRTDQWVDDPDWPSAQTLAVVNYREAGGFNRDIHVDRLPLRSDASK